MFCLKDRSNSQAQFKELSKQDDFGWWLSDEDELKSPRSTRSKDCQSVESSESMLSCIESDDNENYFLAEDYRQECADKGERIELTSLIHNDMDLNLIEQDAIRKNTDVAPFPMENARRYIDEPESKSRIARGMCYTPERLVRSREYRILPPSPRYLSISQARIMPENENRRKTLRCRRQLNYLIDSKQVGTTQLKVLLEPETNEVVVPVITTDHWKNYSRDYDGDNETRNTENETKREDVNTPHEKKPCNNQIPDSIDKICSYEGLNITWEDCGKMGTRSSSLEDTSGIQSNDWSSDTYSDMQNTPLCLSDELATTNFKLDSPQERYSAVNEVVSILEELDTDPKKAAVLLEEDRFCTSSHDQLTRLALTIETDANVSGIYEDPEDLVRLQKKVKKLEDNSKDIYRDIYNLRTSFQCDEQRIANVSSDMNKLRQDVHELRYLDDLLNLLRGELERISKRNWPFIVGRTSHHAEEMNLIV